MKREIPLMIVMVTGIIMFLQYFFPGRFLFIPFISSEKLFEFFNDWVMVIGILSLPLGIWSLVKANVNKLQVRDERFYSAVLLLGFLVMVISGWTAESRTMGVHLAIFQNVLIPIQATIFSLLAFFVASAAYRAFRARSVLATILLLTAFIIMFRFIPLGPISDVNNWLVEKILMVPNMAAKRAIAMGIALGATATAIKIILGIERTYMGRD
jgi:hypothetical protein